MQVVILAGGLGTRLKPLTKHTPKSLISVHGTPFLEYQLELFRRSGVREVLFCLGHMGDQIKRHLTNGSRFGLDIRYSEERGGLLGTAGAIRNAGELLAEEFFLTYGDSYLLLDYQAVMDRFLKQDRLGLMVVYRNRDQLERSNVVIEGDFVTVYDKEGHTPGMEAVGLISPDRPVSQEEFYQLLIERKQLLAFETPQRFYEIGSLPRLEEFRRLVAAGGVRA